jgi:hypothetical protein
MATLTKYTQCERLEYRLKELDAAKAKDLADFPKNVEAAYAKKRREAILKLDADAAKMAVNNGLITAAELSAATAPEKVEPAPAAEEQGGKAKAR